MQPAPLTQHPLPPPCPARLQGFSFDEFVDALVVTALHAYGSPRHAKRYPQAEQKAEALLLLLGLERPEDARAAAGSETAGLDAAGDPYKAWWQLDLEAGRAAGPGAARGGGEQQPGVGARLALIPECVVPPADCLLAARGLLEGAFEAHASRRPEEALQVGRARAVPALRRQHCAAAMVVYHRALAEQATGAR
jgi:hypothetical protein